MSPPSIHLIIYLSSAESTFDMAALNRVKDSMPRSTSVQHNSRTYSARQGDPCYTTVSRMLAICFSLNYILVAAAR